MTFLHGRGAGQQQQRNWRIIGRLLGLFSAAFLIFLACYGLWLWSYAVTPGTRGADAPAIQVLIPPKTSFAGIQQILAEKGLIRPDRRFFHLARLLRSSQRLKAGEYLLSPGQTPYEMLQILEAGAVVPRAVTIPEGVNIYQVADILAAGGWGTQEEILQLLRDKDILGRFGVEGESLEGYLFPDTYHLVHGQSPEGIIKMMVERGRQVREGLGNLTENRFGLSAREVIILASIVEKETGVPEERPLIARVFLNRLALGMRLQTDPTVIYGIAGFDGNLTRKDLQTVTPYNTYMVGGLPPGPIANPGREAILAVLQPSKDSYLYFVSKNDGTHHFSKTLAEHNRAVFLYQKRK